MKKITGLIFLAAMLFVPNTLANANEEEFYENLKTCTPYNAYYPNNGAGKIITGGTTDSCEVTVINYPDKYYKCTMTRTESLSTTRPSDRDQKAPLSKLWEGLLKYSMGVTCAGHATVVLLPPDALPKAYIE